jgi:methylated-DNA-[protein]-cysteine S-methyltransferase
MPALCLRTPLGPVAIVESAGAITALSWGAAADAGATPTLTAARRQLERYFAGELTAFDLRLAPPGTAFQRRVWQAMCEIPYGQTWSYGALADRVGSAPRAVGQACARNPIAIVIPCHRVVGADRRLTGYSGGQGLTTKAQLLALEAAACRDRSRDKPALRR